MDWNDWLAELILHADDLNSRAATLIAKYPHMYEDYYEEGMTYQEAFAAEWG